jgi:hypothetical protein
MHTCILRYEFSLDCLAVIFVLKSLVPDNVFSVPRFCACQIYRTAFRTAWKSTKADSHRNLLWDGALTFAHNHANVFRFLSHMLIPVIICHVQAKGRLL